MLLQFVSNIIASFAENSVYLRTRVTMILQLAIDQCHGSGFEELCRKQYCRADAAKNGPSMGSTEYAAFSCSDCSPGTMYDPHVCKQPILHSSSSSNQVTEWSNDQMTGWQDDRELRRRLTVWYISSYNVYLFYIQHSSTSKSIYQAVTHDLQLGQPGVNSPDLCLKSDEGLQLCRQSCLES